MGEVVVPIPISHQALGLLKLCFPTVFIYHRVPRYMLPLYFTSSLVRSLLSSRMALEHYSIPFKPQLWQKSFLEWWVSKSDRMDFFPRLYQATEREELTSSYHLCTRPLWILILYLQTDSCLVSCQFQILYSNNFHLRYHSSNPPDLTESGCVLFTLVASQETYG